MLLVVVWAADEGVDATGRHVVGSGVRHDDRRGPTVEAGPVGALIAGLGLDPALLVVGLAYFLVTIGAAVAVPGYRDMDRHPNQSAVEVS